MNFQTRIHYIPSNNDNDNDNKTFISSEGIGNTNRQSEYREHNNNIITQMEVERARREDGRKGREVDRRG